MDQMNYDLKYTHFYRTARHCKLTVRRCNQKIQNVNNILWSTK